MKIKKTVLLFTLLPFRLVFGAEPCLIKAIPGVALGPIRIGSTAEEVKASVKVTRESSTGKDQYMEAGVYRISLRDNRVREVWVEDIRAMPECISIGGKKVNTKIKVAAIPSLYGPCEREDLIGGSFYHCKGSTLHFGFGMGTSLQLLISDKFWRVETRMDSELGNIR